MKIQTPTEFLTFTDGKCDIYSVKGNVLDQKLMTLDFGDRTLGIRRFYVARAASTEINRVIHVPLQRSITADNRAVIGGDAYKIDLAQYLDYTNPPVTVLTLKK